jgi:His-Xaa-Ser system protein HxsD
MEQIIFKEDNKFLNIFIPQKLFSKEAVVNCLYWRINEFNIHFSVFSDKEYLVSIDLTGLTLQQKNDLINSFSNELLDFELREVVNKETKNIRELIIAKAFANGALDDLEL